MEKLKSEDCSSEDKDANSLEDWEMEIPEAVKSSDSKDQLLEMNSSSTNLLAKRDITIHLRFICFLRNHKSKTYDGNVELDETLTIGHAIEKLNYRPFTDSHIMRYQLRNYTIFSAKNFTTGEPIDYDTVVQDGNQYYISVIIIFLRINDEPLTSMRVYYNTTFSEMLLYQKLNKESRIYEKDELYGFVFIGGKKRCEENATYIIREPPIAPQITKCSSPQCSPQAQVPLAVEYWPLFAFILLVIFMFFITSLVHEYSERVCAFQQAYDVLRQQLNDTKGI